MTNSDAERATNADPPWQICGAKAKSTGLPCRGKAMQPSGRCRLHGGRSLVGVASPSFKTGRHSKYFAASLPPHLRARYEAALTDPELLSHRKYVALFSARVLEVLDRFAALDCSDYRQRLLEFWTQFKDANAVRAESDSERAAKAARIGEIVTKFDKLIADGAAEDVVWAELNLAIKDALNAAALERRRLVEMDQILTVEQAASFVQVLYAIVTKSVKDKKILSEIGVALRQQLHLGGPIVDVEPAERA
jgi:hypothetical protein